MANESDRVIEGWTGPGRRDAVIELLKPVDDGLHLERPGRGRYEWWYFDAHLETGHTIVVFFHASNPNPGLEGKAGIEIVLLRPDGVRIQKFYAYPRSQFAAAWDKPEVTIGGNRLRVRQTEGGLPVYQIDIEEKGLGCHLRYTAQVDGWKPGTGLSQFGKLGYFGWAIPFARASVEGTITDGDRTFQGSGIGYHDHNWLNFPFPTVIDYWMWGRVYSENLTAVYAYIQCNQKVDRHTVKVLMLADGRKIALSTGEFDFRAEDYEYSPKAKYRYPREIGFHASGMLKLTLKVKRVLEAQDMLENFNPVLRFLAKNILRIKPGYFRLVSDAEMAAMCAAKTIHETGTALHEIVLFKPSGQIG